MIAVHLIRIKPANLMMPAAAAAAAAAAASVVVVVCRRCRHRLFSSITISFMSETKC